MRQLIGKIKRHGTTQEVYLSEHVLCRECHRTVPVGIDVVTVQLEGKVKKLLKHAGYCRAHGGDYQAQVHGGD
jgi:hypothetical protein